ncbi:hypothetical protein Ccrd_006286 [Cynara cardunculus var. scolymus]|uniref:Uncharacterized protein n=1 Tax=Cynara cardunculus var. scolymus TaxID=59895 RepID=A0A124SBU0_CYNCS|nr:hypothetical protein Ccrd_006286 [Cynara cardunculus var. scolymus]
MNAISIGLPFSPITNPPWRDTTSDRTSYLTSLALPVQFTRSQSCFLLRQRNHRRLLLAQSTMSSSGEILQSNPSQRIELRTESDFEQIVSPDETLSICGFGSLLSERSARSTFPDLINFRVAKLNGFRRVFAHVAPIFFERGIAKPETKEVSSLSVEPCEGESLIVTVFEIKKSEVHPETLEGNQYSVLDIVMRNISRIDAKEAKRYTTSGMDDLASRRSGKMMCCLVEHIVAIAYANFLDHTYLADRKTTLRKYLATAGSGLMEEEPPELLKVRYGG